MLAKLLLRPFGDTDNVAWALKTYSQSGPISFLRKFARAFYHMYQYENASSIAWNACFAGPPCFPHGMKSIFVSGGASIGKNCVIFQQVTIGSVTLPDSPRYGAPVIGDNVYIGAGAKIVGGAKIGNNVRIGANAVVFEDVPDNAVVVCGEQRVIVKDTPPDNCFYSQHAGRWVYFEDGKFQPVKDPVILEKLSGHKEK